MAAGSADVVEALGAIPLFSGFSDKQLKRLAAAMRDRTVDAGQELTVEGRGGTGFFVIEYGDAVVLQGGHETARLGPGDAFGEMALIDSGPRSATVRAESEMRCHGLTPWEFKPLVNAHPEIA